MAKGLVVPAALAALAVWLGTGVAQAKDYPNGYDPASGLTWDEDFGWNGGMNPFGVVNFNFRRAALYPESYANQGMGPYYYSAAGYYQPLYAGQPVLTQNYSYGTYTPAQNNEARLRLMVPSDAKVWFDGKPTQQSGTVRNFESPPLTPGQQYTYDIKVQWRDQNGKEVSRTRRVDVSANAAIQVDFARQ